MMHKFTIVLGLGLLLSFLLTQCKPSESTDTFTAEDLANPLVLSIESLNDLRPFLDNVKPIGKREVTPTEIVFNDSITAMHQLSVQSYSFTIWVDEKNQPVAPNSEQATAARKRAGGMRNGTITLGCIGVCIPIGPNAPCSISGCDDTQDCNCTPLVCSGCTPNGCKYSGSILVYGGGLFMQ